MLLSKLKSLYQKNKRNIVFILTLATGLYLAAELVDGFLDILEELGEKDLAPYDDAIAGFVDRIRSEPLTDFFIYASRLGDQEFYFIAIPILAVIIYLIYGRIKKVARLILVLIVASSITHFLKDFIERARPQGEHLVEVTTSSFPSGHTVSGVAFYGFLIYIFWTSGIKSIYKILITVLLVIIILSIGLSRIYLGVHYASDVAAGYLAGGFFLLVFILAFYISRFYKNNKTHSKP